MNLENRKNNKKLPILKKILRQQAWKLFITLTYREAKQYRIGHIQLFTETLTSNGISYFYVKELTQTGIPHFHILIDKEMDKSEISVIWNNIVNEDLEAGTNVKEIDSAGAINYILQDFSEYGSSLNLELLLHREAQKLLEEDTLNKSCEKLEEEIAKEKDSAAYKLLFNYFATEENIRKFEANYYRNFEDKRESIDRFYIEYFRSIDKRLAFKVIAIIFLKYQHVEYKWKKFLSVIAFQVYSLGTKRKYRTQRDFDENMERDGLKIGFVLVSLFVNSLGDLVEEEYIPYSSLEGKEYITQRFNLHVDLGKLSRQLVEEGFVFGSLPMLCKPNDWTRDELDLRSNFSGGFLLNDTHHLFPLTDTPDAKVILEKRKDDLIDAVNKLQSSKFLLDWEVYDKMRSEYKDYLENNLKKSTQQLLDAYRKFYSKRDNGTEFSLETYLKRSCRYLSNGTIKVIKDHQVASEYLRYLSDRSALIEFERIEKLLEVFRLYLLPGDGFYFPYKIDFRGRFYANSDLSPVTNKFIRSLLRSFDYRPFNLDWFKFHATKAYSKDKMSFSERVFFFDRDAFLQGNLRRFDRGNFFSPLGSCANHLEFYNVASEWKKYQNYLEIYGQENAGNYLSNFLISVDATSSGNQIIALLLEDSRYKFFLNLNAASVNGKPLSFYGEIGNEYYQNCENTEIKKILDNMPDSVRSDFLKTIFKEYLMKGAYGLTAYSFQNNLKYIISTEFERYFNVKLVFMLSDSIIEDVKKRKIFLFLEMLKNYAQIYAKYDQKIVWTTPLGLRIELCYPQRKRKRFQIKLKQQDTKSKTPRFKHVNKSITFMELTNLLDKKKLILSLPPDFIHSFDAAIIGLFAISMKKNANEVPFFAVHDCVLAATGDMNFIHQQLRKINYNVFSTPRLFAYMLDLLDTQLLNYADSVERQLPKTEKEREESLSNRIRKDVAANRLVVDNLINEIRKDNNHQPFDYFSVIEAFNMYS